MNRPKPVYVLGAGGHAKVVVSALQAVGVVITGLFDDDRGKWNRQDQRKRCQVRLNALHAASKFEDLNIPGFDAHLLHGKPSLALRSTGRGGSPLNGSMAMHGALTWNNITEIEQ